MYYKKGGNTLLYIDKIIEIAKIKEGMKIADFGCGAHGTFVFNASEITGNSGIVYAADVFKGALENIDKIVKSESYRNIKTVWSNLENYKATKINSMSLDLAFLINVLHQSDKKVDILREVIRTMKKGARLIIVDWGEGASLMGPDKSKKINKENLIIALQRLGLNIEEEFVGGKFHFGLLLKKI